METKTKEYVQILFEGARNRGNVGHYLKFQQVVARPAKVGETIVTMIDGEQETKNTAKKGDYVVRSKGKNKEEYIISGEKFKTRYVVAKDSEEDKDGFKTYDPTGDCWAFQYNGDDFKFVAPWGEEMLVKSGDYIASTAEHDLNDVYRIARGEFNETYKKDN